MSVFSSSDDESDDSSIHPNMKSSFKTYFHSIIGNGQVAELVLWRNTRLSASIVLGVTAIWSLLQIYDYNFVSLVCHFTIFAMFIIYATYTLAKYTQWDVPDFEEIRIPESTFKWVYRTTNKLLLLFYYTATGEDLVRFFLTVTMLWMISAIGNHFSSLDLIYLCFVCIGTLPALYERHEREVDYVVSKGMKDVTVLFN